MGSRWDGSRLQTMPHMPRYQFIWINKKLSSPMILLGILVHRTMFVINNLFHNSFFGYETPVNLCSASCRSLLFSTTVMPEPGAGPGANGAGVLDNFSEVLYICPPTASAAGVNCMMTRIDLPPERKVGHLTLIREARSISPKEFNALSRDERLEIIRRAHGKQKYDLIIEACDFDELISRLPAQEVYLLVKELGFEAVPDLLAQMSAFQITACLDLDAWQGDSLDAKSVLPWLVPLLARPDEEAARSLYDLDFPLLVMALKSLMTVTAGPEDIEDEDARIEAIRRDGGYAVEFPDPEDAKAIGALLALLFRQDEGFFHQLLEAVRYESRALLEEEVYQQRCRRLEDLGFPGPFEALSVYRWLDPQTFDPRSEQKVEFAPGEEGVTPPGFLLT
ncbi:MAG TPA: DUF6178 family protein, partial [Desulfuromonadales bacterium]|nr:DUF6178 family protein [Desulfuromonadales bacterium]